MRVTVDEQKCQGHARCLAVAPTAFDYDEEHEVAMVLPEAGSASAEELREAESCCPERAITLEREETR